MKKIFTITSLLVLMAVAFVGCTKRSYNNGYDETDYWLRKESGVVVYSDDYCPYIVIETYNGYTVVRNLGYQPFEGDEIYGDLSRRGVMDLYNYTDNSITRGEVTDYWLSYADAQYIIDNLCYTYGKSGEKKVIRTNVPKNAKRTK
ncbi:MAG: hypothetical protein EOO05_14990 [Chitinophagaceae bacterium]|nr:MAG: hypothetical protein EOO05_14990 [Chitinophagaceae bacterium]